MAVRSDTAAICAMAGNNKNTILPTIKQSNAKLKDAKRDLALIITPRNKGESSKVKLSIMPSSMFPKIELLKESSKVLSAKKDSNPNLKPKQEPLFNLSSWHLNKMTSSLELW